MFPSSSIFLLLTLVSQPQASFLSSSAGRRTPAAPMAETAASIFLYAAVNGGYRNGRRSKRLYTISESVKCPSRRESSSMQAVHPSGDAFLEHLTLRICANSQIPAGLDPPMENVTEEIRTCRRESLSHDVSDISKGPKAMCSMLVHRLPPYR